MAHKQMGCPPLEHFPYTFQMQYSQFYNGLSKNVPISDQKSAFIEIVGRTCQLVAIICINRRIETDEMIFKP